MRIWHQGFVELETVPAYRAALARHVASVASPGTEVVLHGLRPGTCAPDASPADLARYGYLADLHAQQILENVRRAEREGYDAVAIAIVQDLALTRARSLVDIPVAAYGEAAMHLACMLGERFAVVAFNADLFPWLRLNARAYGLEARLGPMVPLGLDYRDIAEAFHRPERLVEAFLAAAREALRDGADVIIPGQTIMAEALFQAGVTRVDDAPVVDAVGTVVKTAELLAGLRASSGVSMSRRDGLRARPPERLVRAARRAYGLDRAPLLAAPAEEAAAPAGGEAAAAPDAGPAPGGGGTGTGPR